MNGKHAGTAIIIDIEERDRLIARLRLIDLEAKSIVGGGAVLESHGTYLAGNPVLLTTHFEWAFIFADTVQAARVLIEFNGLLRSFRVTPLPDLQEVA